MGQYFLLILMKVYNRYVDELVSVYHERHPVLKEKICYLNRMILYGNDTKNCKNEFNVSIKAVSTIPIRLKCEPHNKSYY